MNVWMSDKNPHIPSAIASAIADAMEGREPMWYAISGSFDSAGRQSYASAENGHIGNPFVGAAYVRAYNAMMAATLAE